MLGYNTIKLCLIFCFRPSITLPFTTCLWEDRVLATVTPSDACLRRRSTRTLSKWSTASASATTTPWETTASSAYPITTTSPGNQPWAKRKMSAKVSRAFFLLKWKKISHFVAKMHYTFVDRGEVFVNSIFYTFGPENCWRFSNRSKMIRFNL